MKKVKTFFIIIALIVLGFCTSTVFASETPVLRVETITAYTIEDMVSVPIILDNNSGFVSLGIEIEYDESKLSLISVDNNTSIIASFVSAKTYDTIPYNMSWLSADEVLYSGTIAVLKFKVLNIDEEFIPIKISFYKGRNGDYVDGVDLNYDKDFNSLNMSYINGGITFKYPLYEKLPNGNIKINLEIEQPALGRIIIVAVYDNMDNCIEVNTYSVSKTISDEIMCGKYIKIMQWNNLNLCPLAEAQTIGID